MKLDKLQEERTSVRVCRDGGQRKEAVWHLVVSCPQGFLTSSLPVTGQGLVLCLLYLTVTRAPCTGPCQGWCKAQLHTGASNSQEGCWSPYITSSLGKGMDNCVKLQDSPGATRKCWCGQALGHCVRIPTQNSFWDSSDPPIPFLRIMARLYAYFTSLHRVEDP